MFSGIIEKIGTVKSKNEHSLVIESEFISKISEISESICVSGACLTIINKSQNSFSVNVVEETISRTNLGLLLKGSNVNLESSLKLGGKIGGHMVQGHIDCTAKIESISKKSSSWDIKLEKPKNISRYIIEKGFICIDGASLTITHSDESSFNVVVIPYTWENTIFSGYEVGTVVNLEVDMTAKYIENFMAYKTGQG
jgi:riboflavin synthase